jgi:hypothetical protein
MASTADACSCYANPPCAAAWRADAVFIARVAYVATEPVGGKLRWQIYGLNVDRVFLGQVDSSLTFTPGQKPSQQQIASADAHVGDVGYVGSCDFQFKEGETDLVFARRTADGPSASTDARGTFKMDAVLPGTYHLAVNARWGPQLKSPYLTTFWPGTLSRSEARTVEIAEGERRTGLTLSVSRLVETTLSGVAVYEDGRPAVGALVWSSLEGRTLPMQRASTDASGRFELRVWVGHEHRIQARMPKTDSTPAGSVVETYVSVGDKPAEGVRLVVSR